MITENIWLVDGDTGTPVGSEKICVDSGQSIETESGSILKPLPLPDDPETPSVLVLCVRVMN